MFTYSPSFKDLRAFYNPILLIYLCIYFIYLPSFIHYGSISAVIHLGTGQTQTCFVSARLQYSMPPIAWALTVSLWLRTNSHITMSLDSVGQMCSELNFQTHEGQVCIGSMIHEERRIKLSLYAVFITLNGLRDLFFESVVYMCTLCKILH